MIVYFQIVFFFENMLQFTKKTIKSELNKDNCKRQPYFKIELLFFPKRLTFDANFEYNFVVLSQAIQKISLKFIHMK